MKINNYNIRRKGLEPLIATILLIVVSVILVTIILSFGKGFTTDALDKTQGIADIKPSDATHFIYPKAYENGVTQFTYSPPSSLQGKTISITSYQILELPDVAPITLTTPYTLKEGTNTLPLNCLYEHSLSSPDFTIQLITEDNTYITIKQRDAGMVCTSTGDGSEATPKIICSAEDLNNVRNNLDANYSLGKNIDLGCFLSSDINGWVPIGNRTNRFKGSFDGQNHKIKKLYIYRPTTDYIGLFGYMAPSSILQNMKLEDVNISGYDRVGGLAGKSIGVVNNVFTSGKITGYTNVGGIAGENVPIGTVMSKCNSSADVNGYSRVGGLVGNNDSALIQTSYATGIITGTTYVGGFVGLNELGSAVGTILSSYSIGSVSGTTNYGGFVGQNSEGIIKNSYSSGPVTRLTGSDTNFGGFVGYNQGSISNSYSLSTVSGNSWSPTDKGFCGAEDIDNINYLDLNNFYDTETSLQTSTTGNALGKTSLEMKTQSTFTDWDFSTVWAIDSSKNDGYPYLINNPPR